MAIVHENTTTFNAASSNSTAPTIPAQATSGRLIVLCIRQNNLTTQTFTFPSGFTQLIAPVANAAGQIALAYKIAASEAGTSPTISSTGTGTWHGQYSIYSGVNTTTPMIAGSANGGTCATTTLTVNAVTMTTANSVLFAFYCENVGATFTTGTMTERSDFTSATLATESGSADEAIAATGTTGTRSITASSSVSAWRSLSGGVNPAAAAAATSFIWPTETPYRILSRR